MGSMSVQYQDQNKGAKTMSALTIDMLRDAARKMGSPPPKQEIKCGDLDEFIAAIKRQTGQDAVRLSRSLGFFKGIEVKVSAAVPVDKAIVLEDGQVKSIINLREGG
jgi:hypothetical protein